MGYLIAAYAITFGTLAAYALHLARERRALVRQFEAEQARNRG